MKNCVKCGEIIPEGRLKALPNVKTCVSCVSTKKYGVVSVINHKTGNEAQIVKDPELAEKINKASKRTNYGVSVGMKSSLS